MKRKISILLLLAMLSSLAVSCGGDNNGDGTETKNNQVTTTDTKEDVPYEVRLDLDPDLDYSNDPSFNILNYEGIGEGSDEENASERSRAVYMQRVLTEDRLGVELTFKNAPTYKDLPGMVTQSINTNTDDYQLVYGAASTVVGLVNSGYMTSANDLTHVNLDKTWWNDEYSRSVSINENDPYVLFGDIAWNMIDRTCAVLFNKDLLLEHHGMTDAELYDIILDGKWTIDKMAELADLYIDNGNNKPDVDDIHGVTYNGAAEFNYMAFGAGLTFSTRDEDGYPVIPEAPSERMVELVDKLLPMFTGTSALSNSGLETNAYAKKFGNGKALFLPSRLFVASWAAIKEMEDDYGIIPMPKFDETIDGYHSSLGSLVAWALVPQTVLDLDKTSAVIECLAYEGYQQVTPAYYESSLKLKTTRGDDVDTESEIIDMIRYGARTDFIYATPLGNLSNIFTNCYNMNSNQVTAAYAAAYVAAQTTMALIIDALATE